MFKEPLHSFQGCLILPCCHSILDSLLIEVCHSEGFSFDGFSSFGYLWEGVTFNGCVRH